MAIYLQISSNLISIPLRFLLLTLLLGAPGLAFAAAAPSISVIPERSSGIYQPGEKIIWTVKVNDDPTTIFKTAHYAAKFGDFKPLSEGILTFGPGKETATVEVTSTEPGAVLLVINTPDEPGRHGTWVVGGAIVAYDKIGLSVPCPDDFDAFWKSKLDQLHAIPPNPVLEKEDSGRAGVDYWKVTLDNINGTHIRGQLARPSGDKKLPAMLIMQYAGIYPLQKSWVTDRAAEGWLVLDIEPHDIPIDQPKDYYGSDAVKKAVSGYPVGGDNDRDTCYFLRVFLGDVQSTDYLAQRPDWDGKTLVATGGSQGGWQSFATAALDPKVTALVACVPAGCDNSGALAHRSPGWPFGITWGLTTPEHQQILKAIAYYDSANFASRIKCPALIGVGLLDNIAPATGVCAAFNQLQGPKELTIMMADHEGHWNTQAAWNNRATAWRAAFLAGQPAPLIPNP
jgi:cephalosporin-C deacetylase-like acetyl esterase